jgi:hypothetical protein
MFVGHYAASFYFKARNPGVPLWALFVAVQLVDLVWAVLVLLGVEHLAMVPGITRASPLDLEYVPYTHSLVAAAGWSLLAGWLWFRGAGQGRGSRAAAILVGAAVLSHWLADVLVHRPDLPLYDNADKVGLGLWNYPVISYPLEVGLLGLAMWHWYRRSNRQAAPRSLLLLWTFMALLQAYTNFGRLPSSPEVFVVMAFAWYVVFAFAARRCDLPPMAPVTP